ncbi:hypothetical protein GRI38_06830 [Altererythrobacter aurantiacus]|uniref:SnoaL-like domain-containing protein n=1 Tax=Parapontixanthobacter aurantiacus TaxID=1463599 RepID=A0A844ZCZ7_9SPHN|nr:nuclear transport factor 2 family protein [Parapontixanthobacter aurantiacus]MXO85745.1 hypothetical protein [Parapontixanthobacter aurantiacus]
MSMFFQTSKRAIERYITAMNAHDVEGMLAFVAPHACFVDSQGDAISGVNVLAKVMRRFFEIEPRFRLIPTEIAEFRGAVLIRGSVEADDPDLLHDSLWRTRVEHQRLVFWQSFADGKAAPIARSLAPRDHFRPPVQT